MKKLLFVALLSFSMQVFALNYTISFTGSGASNLVGDVLVQNLTQGTSVTVPAGNVLNLTDATAVEQVYVTDDNIRICPSSVDGKSTVSFLAKQAGVTQINAFGMDGRKITGISTNLQAGSNTFELSLPKGIFTIRVSGNEYAYTAKLINQSATQSNPKIVYVGAEKPTSTNPQKSKNVTLGITTMIYATGDQLLYKAASDIYSTIVTDIPTESKTTNFDFADCTDADGNHYTVVTIGNQTWMAENLKTTKFNDGTDITLLDLPTYIVSRQPPSVYCWYNNDIGYKNTYGALYNWIAVNTNKLAPAGWHVASDADWITLTSYVTVSVNLGISGSVAKALAATTNWATSANAAAIGNDLAKNNNSGFSALPGGALSADSPTYFGYLGINGAWWSSNEYSYPLASYYFLSCNEGFVGGTAGAEGSGLSVRCVKN